MPKKSGGLGRDFYSLLDDNEIDVKKESAAKAALKDLIPRKDQPRKDFDTLELGVLADSIKEHGVLQPILVREAENNPGKYEIVAGERRYRAAGMAGLDEVPIVIMTGDDLEVAKVSLIENVQRKDLNPIEEAMAYRALIDKFDLTQEQVAAQAGKNRSTVTNMLRILDLPEEIIALLRDGKLTTGHAKALLGMEDRQTAARFAMLTVERDWSVRELEKTVKQFNERPADVPKGARECTQKEIYMRDLEVRLTGVMGRRVRINESPRKKVLELTYEDDADLEQLLKSIAGEDIFG